jgi:hypothetical protein
VVKNSQLKAKMRFRVLAQNWHCAALERCGIATKEQWLIKPTFSGSSQLLGPFPNMLGQRNGFTAIEEVCSIKWNTLMKIRARSQSTRKSKAKGYDMKDIPKKWQQSIRQKGK